MTEAITEIEKDDNATLAYMNEKAIIAQRREAGMQMVELGRLLYQNYTEKLYKYLDCETFTEFLGRPEISINYKTANSLINIYRKYVLQLECEPMLLAEAGHAKLQIIKPVVESDPDEWLGKAVHLSRSDLTNEVREAQGKEPKQFGTSDLPFRTPTEPFNFDNYTKFVEEGNCIICGVSHVEKAHFPKSVGAGADKHRNFIPLCRECHAELHAVGITTFLNTYRNKIFDYFYRVIDTLYDKVRQ